MSPLDRFNYHRRRFRKMLGSGPVSEVAERHLSHAAAIQQVLEVSRHEAMLGRKLDAASIAALRDQLPIELMQATIAADAHH